MNINSFKTLIALTTALSLIPVTSAYADSGIFDVLDYDVGYDIENAEILAIELDVDFAALLMEIVSYDDGFVELAIPRGLIDSSFSDIEDDIFYVLIDGTESDFLELDSTDTTFSKPEWAGDEVSDDVRYYNVCLVKNPFTTWS